MSTNFNKFWSVDGKMAEIVCYICTFHLTRLVSLHYLVKGGCSKFLPNTGFVTDCSDLVSNWRRHTVATTFLLTCHCQTCAGCPETIFYVSTGRHLDASARDTVAFLERERDARKASSSIGACVRLRGTFRAQVLTILSWFVITTNNSANKPYSVYCVLTQSSDTLMQIIHFNSYVTIENIWVSQGKAVTWVRLGEKYLYSVQFQPLCHLPTETY